MTKKMDAELKARWIAALRSGDYVQGHESLKDGDKFCCLGVLCDISGWHISGNSVVVDGKDVGYAPIHKVIPGKQLWMLWERNDGNAPTADHPWSFEEMTNYIEENL